MGLLRGRVARRGSIALCKSQNVQVGMMPTDGVRFSEGREPRQIKAGMAVYQRFWCTVLWMYQFPAAFLSLFMSVVHYTCERASLGLPVLAARTTLCGSSNRLRGK
jgi:hypothetical protein